MRLIVTQFEKTFNLLIKPWCIAGFAALLILTYHFIDKPVAIYFHQMDIRGYVHGLSILTMFGKWAIYVILFLISGLFFRYVSKNATKEACSFFLMSCVLVSNIIGATLKITVSRARPELLFKNDLFGFYWFKFNDLYWSFPSGHSITVSALAAGLGIVFPQYFYAILGLAFLVIMSRVLLYFHYLSDVMAGFYFALIVVGVLARYLKQYDYFKKII